MNLCIYRSFLVLLYEKLDRTNQESKLNFKVYVSYGWSIIKPNESMKIEDCLIISDSKMYQQKYQKETLRLNHQGEFPEEVDSR